MRCLIIVLSLCLAATAEAQNLLQDPGFESATSGGQTSNSPWVLTVNFPDGVGAAAQFQTATWASNPGGSAGTGVWIRSFEGIGMPGEPPANAVLYQDVSVTPGMEYHVSAWYKQETFHTTTSTRIGIEFFDGSSMSLGSSVLELNMLHPGDGSWIEFSTSAVAPTGTVMARAFGEMIDGVVGAGNPQSGFFDDFMLVEDPKVPVETSTWGALKERHRDDESGR